MTESESSGSVVEEEDHSEGSVIHQRRFSDENPPPININQSQMITSSIKASHASFTMVIDDKSNQNNYDSNTNPNQPSPVQNPSPIITTPEIVKSAFGKKFMSGNKNPSQISGDSALSKQTSQTIIMGRGNDFMYVFQQQSEIHFNPTDPIFTLKAPLKQPTSMAKGKECAYCRGVYSMFSRRKKWCQFCGKTFCSTCIIQRRRLPVSVDPNRYRICKTCTKKFLYKKMFDEYSLKFDEAENMIEMKRKEYTSLNNTNLQTKNRIEELRSKIEEDQENFVNDIERYEKAGTVAKYDIEILMEKNQAKNRELNKHQQKIQETESKTIRMIRETEKMENQLESLEKQNRELQERIKTMRKQLKERTLIIPKTIVAQQPCRWLLCCQKRPSPSEVKL